MTFSREQKIKGLERVRDALLAGGRGKMTPEEAAYQICLLEDVLKDYQEQSNETSDHSNDRG